MNLCAGWYVYTVTDTGSGCSITDSVEIVFVPCDASITLLDTILCPGDLARIQVDVTGAASGPYTYELYSTPFSFVNLIAMLAISLQMKICLQLSKKPL